MIYLTSSPLSLLSYHLRQLYPKYSYFKVLSKEALLEKLSLGSPFSKQINLINAAQLKVLPELTCSKYNTSYLYTTLNPDLLQDDVTSFTINPLLYRGVLDQFKSVFEPLAYNYFWERFKYTPEKIEIEVKRILLKVGVDKRCIKYSDLVELYERPDGQYFHKLQKTFGTKQCNEYIWKATTQELYVNFIRAGNRLAFVQQNAIKRKNFSLVIKLNRLQEAFINGKMDLRLALIVLNTSLINNLEIDF